MSYSQGGAGQGDGEKKMKKEIREILTIDKQKVCRITTPDERWYGKEVTNQETGLPEIIWLPSVTWIKTYYYTSPYLVKWIAEKGLTEAERIKKEAGTKGDKIHQATEEVDKNGEIGIDAKFLNKETGEMEELDAEELEAIVSYRDFVDSAKPELLANEMVVFADKYAGTLDRIYRIEGQIWIVDIKTSKTIYKDMILQESAYSHSDIDYKKLGISDEEWKKRKLAILQLGYARNNKRYKFTEVADRMDLFELAYQTWEEENSDAKPKQRDFPLKIESTWRKEQIDETKRPKAHKVSQKKK